MPLGVLAGQRGCLLTFHRVATHANWKALPNRNFYIDLDFLDRLISYLGRSGWEFVSMEETVARANGGGGKQRYVNFSIDDGYRDSYELLVPFLRSRGVPVTLYITTGIPDGLVPMWWAGLEDTLLHRDHVVVQGQIVRAETSGAKRNAYARISTAWDKLGPADQYALFCAQNTIDAEAAHWRHGISWQMLRELSRDPLVEIGAHSATHARLSTLAPEAALAELKTSRERLIEMIGVNADHFAFPFGRAGDCGPREFELARHAGYASAATTRKGIIRGQQDAYSLPRNTLNGSHKSTAMVELHLNGLTGIAARILGAA